MTKRLWILLLLLAGLALCGEPGWWMTEPIRWVRTNLRQTDANPDACTGGPVVAEISFMKQKDRTRCEDQVH